MKRILTCLLVLAALCALTVPACADLLWEPRENHFYEQHRNDCKYEGRGYYANGAEGFVTLWDAPKGRTVLAQYENGEKLWVYYIYQDWGLIRRWEDGQELSGWVPLADLSLVYDHISFAEEYAGQIRDYNGEFANYSGDISCINFYEYPGAPEIKFSHDPEPKYMQNLLDNLTGAADDRSAIQSVFTDEDGRLWGYVDYLYGHLEAWFCLDEPDGTDFPTRQVSEAALTPAQAPVLPAVSYTPYVLVGAVVAVTAGLLYWFYARKRGQAA